MTATEIDDRIADEILRREILPLYFPDDPRGGAPALILVAGQAGAGRARAAASVSRDTDPGAAVLSGDELRAFHPAALDRTATQESAAAVARDVAGWMSACIRFARENRRSVVLEGTFANVAAAAGTAQRFEAEGFRTHVVVVGSRRVESLLTVASGYLRHVQAGRPAVLTTRATHDEGFEATRRMIGSLEDSPWADRLTVVGRNGANLFDADRAAGFEGAAGALAAGQSARLSRFDAAQWLSELHHAAKYAASRRGLPAGVAELMVELHQMSLREVIPELQIPAAGRFATAMEQKAVAALVAWRQAAPTAGPVDIAAPPPMPGGPERGGVSR